MEEFDTEIYSKELQSIAQLRVLSPRVEMYFSNAEYMRIYGQDNYDIPVLLYDAYMLILQELNDIGIYVDEAQALTDYYEMEQIYILRRLVDPTELTLLLSTNIQIYEDVETIFTQDRETDTEDIEYLEELLIILHDAKIETDVVSELLDSYGEGVLISNDRLGIYLKSILATAKTSITDIYLGDRDKTVAYMKKISLGRLYFRRAMEYMANRYHFTLDPVAQAIAQYDLDKIHYTTIRYYSYFDDEELVVDDLTPSLKKKYKEFMVDRHHTNSVHHFEYWKSRGMEVELVSDLCLLVAHFFEPDTTLETALDKVKELSAILTEEMLVDARVKLEELYANKADILGDNYGI